MGAIEKFLKRWGYTKLDRYGLVLTSEDRVLTNRSDVLVDGLGNRIVGWLDGDLAAMELEKFGVKKKGPPKKIRPPAGLSKPVPAPEPAPAHQPAAPIAFAPTVPQPARPLPGVAAVAKVAAPVAARPPSVAAEPQVDEDDWEWEIAMARARAAADEVEEARRDLLGAAPVIVSAAVRRKTTPGIAIPSPRPDPFESKTEPLMDRFEDKSEVKPQVLSPLQKTLLVETSMSASPKRTVIPVPQLPTVADPRSLQPVTRRFARGTGRMDETTQVGPAPEDRTSPYVELPPEVKPSGFAHIKRVAAKQR